MKILLLGDIMGPSGRNAVIENLPILIKKKKLDFVILNGENAADPGVGITKEIVKNFFKAGADVITTGNHVWDQKEIVEFIAIEKRLLRPQNLVEGTPGNGFGIYNAKNKYPYAKKKFDLAISTGCFHNLEIYDLKFALKEIQRVSKKTYIMVESYRNDKELFNLQCWALTCESFFSEQEWKWLFEEFGYNQNYEFIYFS